MGMVLADSGLRVYQWVYPGSMVSILVFGITKGFMFTKTTLMASSSLHDRVFDKVQSPCPSPWGLHTYPGTSVSGVYTDHLRCARRCAGLWGRHSCSLSLPLSLPYLIINHKGKLWGAAGVSWARRGWG